MLAASAPAGPLEVADDPCQVILSATGLIARTAAESEEATEARRRSGRVKHDAVRAVVHSTARGRVLLVTSTGRAFKIDVLPLPVLPEQSGTVSIRGGMSASELVPLEKGERVVGLAPLTNGDSPGLAMGTRQGVIKVCAPEWPVRSDEFEVISLKEGDEVLQATWLTDNTESLVFVTSDASLLRFPAKLVRPQGLKGGGMAGHQPDGRRGGAVLQRGQHDRSAARRADGGDVDRHAGQGDAVRAVSGEGPRDRRGPGSAVPEGRDPAHGGLGGSAAGRGEQHRRPG